VVITLADVDLVYIGLNLLVSSVETALRDSRRQETVHGTD